MKVKQSPADFRVEELTDRTGEPSGGFALYRLDKTGWTTPDAVAEVCRAWNVDRNRVSFGGLKDRHAVTSQHLTIEGGPPGNLELDHVSLSFLGPASVPFTSADVRANRFAVTVRNLSAGDAAAAVLAAGELAAVGLPNYFDDQRFGSVGGGGEFVGRLLVRGEFEAALKLALTEPYEHDRSFAKRAKAALRKHWGNWRACRNVLPRPVAAVLLRNPTAFRDAVTRLHPELQGMSLAAYQSDLWNRTLAGWLKESFPADSLGSIRSGRGTYPLPVKKSDVFDGLLIPLPSARMRSVPDAAWWPAMETVLREEGLTLGELRVPGVRKPFFSKGERAACVRPEGLKVSSGEDEMHAGRKKGVLHFDLPRGSYATLVVKRLVGPRSAPKTPRRG